MEEEDFGQISLNLSTDHLSLTSSRKKVFGDRKQRIRQRKDVKLSKASVSSAEIKPKHTDLPQKRKWQSNTENKEVKDDEHENSSGKKRKSNVVISSLFNKNPEIPQISSAEVDTVTENVFTGDRFKDLPLHPYLISNLEEKQGFAQMTEVQKQAIPVLLKGKDALVKSQTGSGKTLAYAVPIVQLLQSRKVKIKRNDGPYALVIVPTRELALQSYETFVKLLRTFVWIVPGCLMGGEKRKGEKSRLRKGVNILVGTPGRLIDHIKSTNVLSLASIQWLVIDEADRLLEMGYEKDVAQILNAVKAATCEHLPQTVLLSATLSEAVERLSSITLNNAEHINVADAVSHTSGSSHSDHSSPPLDKSAEQDSTSDVLFTVPHQLKQYFIVTPCKLRLVTLAALILWKCKYSKPASKIIVFLSTQDSVEFHSQLFSQVLVCQRDIKKTLTKLSVGVEDVGDSDDDEGEEIGQTSSLAKHDGKKQALKIFHLHGDMLQKDRTQTYNEFSKAKCGVLLCTDVAARGLDLPHVDWIVQYTSPGATVDYIHRVGRTARAGSKGHSLLFLMPAEADYIQELNRHKISLSQMQLSTILQNLLANIADLPPAETVNTSRQTPRTQEEAATYLQDRFEECVLRNKQMHGRAGKGFQSYVRAYATYSKEVKDFMKVSDLHLGHVAKSFALREAPTKVQGVTLKFGGSHKTKQQKYEKQTKRPLTFKQASLSEYSAGFQVSSRKLMAKPGGKRKPKHKKKKMK